MEMKTIKLEGERAKMADEALRKYEKHVARLQTVLTEEHGFPEIDYESIVELSGRPEGAVVHWGRTLRHTPEYLEATARISDTAFKGLDILDKAHRPCTLPDDFYGRAIGSREVYEAMRDALFDEDAALSHKGDFIFEPIMPVSATRMWVDGELGGLELIDGYFTPIPKTVTPPLVDMLRGRVATAFERPVRDEEASFDAWVCHGYGVLDDALTSGTVKDLSLLSRMGDEGLSKDVRMGAFVELRDKYCGVPQRA